MYLISTKDYAFCCSCWKKITIAEWSSINNIYPFLYKPKNASSFITCYDGVWPLTLRASAQRVTVESLLVDSMLSFRIGCSVTDDNESFPIGLSCLLLERLTISSDHIGASLEEYVGIVNTLAKLCRLVPRQRLDWKSQIRLLQVSNTWTLIDGRLLTSSHVWRFMSRWSRSAVTSRVTCSYLCKHCSREVIRRRVSSAAVVLIW